MDRCLLQATTGGYRLHDLVLEYLQLTIRMDGGGLAEKATSRQARYLGRLDVFQGYASVGENGRGLYPLIALWHGVQKFDAAVDVGECYAETLEGKADTRTWTDVGWLLVMLVRISGIPVGAVFRTRGPSKSMCRTALARELTLRCTLATKT